MYVRTRPWMCERSVIFTGFLLVARLLFAQPDAHLSPASLNFASSAAVPDAASSSEALPAATAPASVPLNNDRIFKIIPNYQTVEDSNRNIAPLTPKEKWHLAWKETVDPFNFASAAAGALWSQSTNSTPRYGQGGAALGERFGAALADFSTQNFLSTGFFATVLQEDPRYFRKGPSAGLFERVGDSLKQTVFTRRDSGGATFNGSNFLGMAAGIGISNIYYPPASRRGSVMLGRVFTGLTGDVMGNLMSEFWPDVRKKLFHKKAN